MNPSNLPSELLPTENLRIYDLVEKAGVNVNNWGNFKGGKGKASTNPKFCYDWAFVEEGKVVALCLWLDDMKSEGDSIFQNSNHRAFSNTPNLSPVVIRRARRMDDAIRYAFQHSLPVRVIVCNGRRRDKNNPDSITSSVKARKLDPETWSVSRYDNDTGNCVITRGEIPIEVFDQYSATGDPARKKAVTSDVFCRDRMQRNAALRRAAGNCEYCNNPGFQSINGYIYLETHHVVPLSEKGADDESNIVALCANDHRQAHYGKNRMEMRKKLLEVLSKYYPKKPTKIS